MHKDITPIEIVTNMGKEIRRYLSRPRDQSTITIPREHFTHCFDFRNFSLAPIRIQTGEGSVSAYQACCGNETAIMYEDEVLDWLKERGMSHQSALNLLLAVNERNRYRII